MNLWLRLFWFLCFSWLAKRNRSPLEEQIVSFRAMPWDCDVNGHLTNSRYWSFMDLARLDFFYYTNLWQWDKKSSIFPILQSAEISFIRPIMPGQCTTVHTKMLGLDQKYCYIQQKFKVDGKLVADARIRAVLCDGHGRIWATSSLDKQSFSLILPKSIAQWKNYLSLKTEESL